MNLRIRQFELAILSALLCSMPGASRVQAQSATEDQLKAAYLYNFAKFTEWPVQVFDKADSPITFCTQGRSAVVDELDSSVRGKSTNGHTILIRHLRGQDEIKGCHLVFLASSAARQQKELLHAASESPMLLVAEVPGFARAGGTINFILENGRVIFEVNVNSAERAHLKISSKLLSLARIVSTDNERQTQ